MQNRPLVIGAAILGILAIGLTLMSLLGRGGSAPAPGQPGGAPAVAPVVTARQLVANRPIPPRTVITRDMLREDAGKAVVVGAITDAQQIVGKLTGSGIAAGDVFTPAVLVDPIKRAKPANFTIPPGLRAVAVMVDPNTTVGGLVDVGDRVDVVAVHKLRFRNDADQDTETRSGRTISQNLLVLATDEAIKKADTPPAPAPGAPPATNPDGSPAPVPPPPPPPAPAAPPAPGTPTPKVRVVLAAAPLDAERIAAAQGLGDIHLTMRDPSRNDQAAQPEVFEYPIRTIGRRTAQARPAGNTAAANARSEERRAELGVRALEAMTGGGGPRRESSGEMPPVSPQMMPPQNIAPASPVIGIPSEEEQRNSQVTVIRGTEKTKVSVPQR